MYYKTFCDIVTKNIGFSTMGPLSDTCSSVSAEAWAQFPSAFCGLQGCAVRVSCEQNSAG